VAEAELRLASILIERGCSVVSGLQGRDPGDDEAAADDAMATELDAALQILERGSTVAREVELYAREREGGAGSQGAWRRIRAWALELLPAVGPVASGEPEEDAGPVR
jgi:hypothetical protein